MRTTNIIVTVAVAAIMLAANSVANAQIGRNIGAAARNVGNNIGSRLGVAARGNAELDVEQGLVAAPATVTTTASAAQNPGTTRPVAAANAEAPAKTTSDGSEFIIPPNATAEQLMEQASSLLSTNIAFESEDEYTAWVNQMLATVGKIADRILALKPDDTVFVEAISLKGQALCYQASYDSSVLPTLKKYADALAKNARVQSLEDGRNAALAFTGVYLQATVADVAERQGTANELIAAMTQVNAFIKEHPEASDIVVDLVVPVAFVASNLGDEKLADRIWASIRKTLNAANTAETQNALLWLDGTIRYVALVGNEFEWNGCDATGKKIDVEKLKGRVIIVDFFASWVEQCPEIHKQLKQFYQMYHAQGLEIVSYDLDAEIEDMQKYVKANKLPWIVLSDRATVDAKETSLAGYYGVSELPTMILIGGDGKCAATDISMESLDATLRSVFAPKAENAPAAATTSSARTTTPASAATTSAGRAATTSTLRQTTR